MHRFLPALALLLLLPAMASGEPVQFTVAEHRVTGIIPDGWSKLPALNPETAIKISKEGDGSKIARITVMTYPVPPGTFPAGYDVWTMTDKEIEASGADSSEGAPAEVLKFGRAEIDHHHVVWTLAKRKLAEGSTLWQLAYEGIRGAEGITVQLTVAGDEPWYTANTSVFAGFIKFLKLSIPKATP